MQFPILDVMEVNTFLLGTIVSIVIGVIGWLFKLSLSSLKKEQEAQDTKLEKLQIENVKINEKINDVNIKILNDINAIGIKLAEFKRDFSK